MQVTIRFFATLRDRAGVPETTLELDGQHTVGALLDRLAEEFPELEPSLGSALVAVNEEYAFRDEPIKEGDEIALFPPVSGGSESEWPEYFAITPDPLDLDAIVAHITRPETGAVCMFTGAVRGVTRKEGEPQQTDSLFYEAYEEMAEKKLRQVAQEIREQYPKVQGIAIVQRIGHLNVGETTVLVACASGHRHDGAFEAARYGIDRLKEIVPVWKKEIHSSGSQWVEGSYHPTPEDVKQSSS